jgi:hypothetical protein
MTFGRSALKLLISPLCGGGSVPIRDVSYIAMTQHDFRRSVLTTMHERLNLPPHIVEAVLGHVSGHKAGVGGVYNKAQYDEQKRIALEKWAGHVEALVSGERPTAVVKKFRPWA